MSLDPLSGDTWSSRDPMGPPSRSRSPPSAWTASTASTQTPATLCPRTRPEQQKRLRINITYIQLMSVASAPLQKNKKILSMLVPCKIPGAGNRQNQLTNRIGLRGILLSAWVYPYNWQLLHCLGEKAEFAIINPWLTTELLANSNFVRENWERRRTSNHLIVIKPVANLRQDPFWGLVSRLLICYSVVTWESDEIVESVCELERGMGEFPFSFWAK